MVRQNRGCLEIVNIIETEEGVVLEVSVKPKAREFKIAVQADEIVVFCTEEPTKGKVNRELVKKLSRLFRKEVMLVSGFTSKQKRLLIKDAHKSDVESVLLAKWH
jgi:uncharacterized protein (TIGR00251 family)